VKSLQARLIAGGVLVFAISFVAAGVAVYGFTRSGLYGEFDESLHNKIQTFAHLLEETEDGIQFKLDESLIDFNRRDVVPSLFEVWIDDDVIVRSPELGMTRLSRGSGSLLRPAYEDLMIVERPARQISVTFTPQYIPPEDEDEDEDEDDDEYEREDDEYDDEDDEYEREDDEYDHEEFETRRSERFQFSSQSSPPGVPAESGVVTLTWQQSRPEVTIAVARYVDNIEQQLDRLRLVLIFVGLAGAAAGCSVMVLVVRGGLRPIDVVGRKIAAIDENSLSARVPTDRVPTEIEPMVRRLNELLGRLDTAFVRERAFSSNLAHELRTPLAGLRSTLEVYLSRLHEPEEYAAALEACLRICNQSQHLVENLLAIARLETRAMQIERRVTRVLELFDECWSPLAERSMAKGVQTDFQISDDAINTDPEMLRVILRNVLSNAVSHCDEGGTISGRSFVKDGLWELQLANSGNRLSTDDVDRVFDRLWRGDVSRHMTGEHFGLGLTLTKRFVETLGGSVHVSVDTSFRITITLPV